MTNQSNEILVQKYLGGELSKNERDQFEEKLKNSSELQEELELQEDLAQKISDQRLLNFKNRLDHIHREITGERKVYRLFSNRTLSLIAASIIVLLSIGGLMLSKYNGSQSTDEIYSSYYEAYEMSTTQRNTVDTSSEIFKASNAYSNGSYLQAIQLLDGIRNEKTETDCTIEMMLGISNMELENYQEAKLSFKAIIKSKNPFFTQQAVWYQGLCLLKLKQIDDAKKQFKVISEANGFYKDKAIEILELIN